MAIIELGVTESDFRRMTPSSFFILWERWKEKERRTDARFALVATLIANTNRDPNKKPEPFTLEDFMPQVQEESEPLDDDETLQHIRALNAIFGGKEG